MLEKYQSVATKLIGLLGGLNVSLIALGEFVKAHGTDLSIKV